MDDADLKVDIEGEGVGVYLHDSLSEPTPKLLMARESSSHHNHAAAAAAQLRLRAEEAFVRREHELLNCKLPGFPKSTFMLAFSADGTRIASAHGDHNIHVSEVKNGKCIATLTGHARTPWCVSFHPHSNDIVASGCLEGHVRVWDMKGGSASWTAERKTPIASLAFHPSEQVLVIATDTEVLLWDWFRSRPFAHFGTASDREKVRYVKFDTLGYRLFTGISNSSQMSAMPNLTRFSTNRNRSTSSSLTRYWTERQDRMMMDRGTDPLDSAWREQVLNRTRRNANINPMWSGEEGVSAGREGALGSSLLGGWHALGRVRGANTGEGASGSSEPAESVGALVGESGLGVSGMGASLGSIGRGFRATDYTPPPWFVQAAGAATAEPSSSGLLPSRSSQDGNSGSNNTNSTVLPSSLSWRLDPLTSEPAARRHNRNHLDRLAERERYGSVTGRRWGYFSSGSATGGEIGADHERPEPPNVSLDISSPRPSSFAASSSDMPRLCVRCRDGVTNQVLCRVCEGEGGGRGNASEAGPSREASQNSRGNWDPRFGVRMLSRHIDNMQRICRAHLEISQHRHEILRLQQIRSMLFDIQGQIQSLRVSVNNSIEELRGSLRQEVAGELGSLDSPLAAPSSATSSDADSLPFPPDLAGLPPSSPSWSPAGTGRGRVQRNATAASFSHRRRSYLRMRRRLDMDTRPTLYSRLQRRPSYRWNPPLVGSRLPPPASDLPSSVAADVELVGAVLAPVTGAEGEDLVAAAIADSEFDITSSSSAESHSRMSQARQMLQSSMQRLQGLQSRLRMHQQELQEQEQHLQGLLDLSRNLNADSQRSADDLQDNQTGLPVRAGPPRTSLASRISSMLAQQTSFAAATGETNSASADPESFDGPSTDPIPPGPPPYPAPSEPSLGVDDLLWEDIPLPLVIPDRIRSQAVSRARQQLVNSNREFMMRRIPSSSRGPARYSLASLRQRIVNEREGMRQNYRHQRRNHYRQMLERMADRLHGLVQLEQQRHQMRGATAAVDGASTSTAATVQPSSSMDSNMLNLRVLVRLALHLIYQLLNFVCNQNGSNEERPISRLPNPFREDDLPPVSGAQNQGPLSEGVQGSSTVGSGSGAAMDLEPGLQNLAALLEAVRMASEELRIDGLETNRNLQQDVWPPEALDEAGPSGLVLPSAGGIFDGVGSSLTVDEPLIPEVDDPPAPLVIPLITLHDPSGSESLVEGTAATPRHSLADSSMAGPSINPSSEQIFVHGLDGRNTRIWTERGRSMTDPLGSSRVDDSGSDFQPYSRLLGPTSGRLLGLVGRQYAVDRRSPEGEELEELSSTHPPDVPLIPSVATAGPSRDPRQRPRYENPNPALNPNMGPSMPHLGHHLSPENWMPSTRGDPPPYDLLGLRRGPPTSGFDLGGPERNFRNRWGAILGQSESGYFIESTPWISGMGNQVNHRIQAWDFNCEQLPDLTDSMANLVVGKCKIHNDSSVDISSDGTLLVALVPENQSMTIVGVYSLEPRSLGQLLYHYIFTPNTICVSLSPGARHLVVGFATNVPRIGAQHNEHQVVAQIYKLFDNPLFYGRGQFGHLQLLRDIEGPNDHRHTSLNCIRWLPYSGQGLVYGTNRGHLSILQ